MLNKNGIYVLDSAELNRRKEREDYKALKAASEKLVASVEAKTPEKSSESPSDSGSSPADIDIHLTDVRAALARSLTSSKSTAT